MLFYIILILCVSALSFASYYFPNKKNELQWLLFGLLVCIAGFRFHVGIDYDAYVDWYVNKTRDYKFELGYLALMKIFRALHFSYKEFFFLFSLTTLSFVFLGIKKYTNNTVLALLFFFLIPEMYLGSFNLIRQSFSMAISFYAFYFLMNKKYLIFSLMMIFGISIHYTAVVPLFVFILVYKYADQIHSKHVVILLFGSLILSQLNFIQVFEIFFNDTRYSYYFDSPRDHVSLFKTLVLNSIALFVLCYFDKMKAKYPNQKYILLLYFCSVIFMNLFNTFSNIERITYFFKIFEIIVIADLIYLGSKNRKLLLTSCFYIYYVSSFMHTLDTDLHFKSSSKLIPYQTFILDEN
jgi:hypothetical protein